MHQDDHPEASVIDPDKAYHVSSLEELAESLRFYQLQLEKGIHKQK